MADTEILRYESGQIVARLERSEKALVSHVAFRLRERESLSLIGETGSGKTIMAQSVMKLLPANVRQRGERVRYLGRPLPDARGMKRLLGAELVYIPQNGAEFLNPSRSIRRHLYDSLKKLNTPRPALERAAVEKLASAGLERPETLLDKYPFQLSGGMAQRVTIALAACSTPRLVIADEPTNGLDHAAKADFLALLSRLFPEAAKLVITHDMAVAELCDSVLVLCGGKMMEKGPSRLVLRAPRQPYTVALLAAMVKNGMRETPLLRREAGACPFYRRCPKAAERCKYGMAYHNGGASEWWCNAEL